MPLANIDTIGLWKSKSLTNIKNINSKVTYTKMHEVENTTIFNEDIHNRVSNTEEVLILRDAEYLMMKTDSVALGDKLVKFVDNQEVHEVVNKVDSVKEKRNVYEFGREVFGLINASGVLVYHLYPID
jgi:alpha-N-acetylglucosamine transferase